jgi:hypothetical protein
MRRSLVLLTLLALPLTMLAEDVVLKDGRVISASKPYVVKGKQAVITQKNGTVVSVSVDEIDVEKTAAAKRKPAASVAKDEPAKPMSPAEAARTKSTRKASVVLTDEDVSHGLVGSGESGGTGEEGEARVEVTGVTTEKGKGTITVTGSVQNTGKGEASAVTVLVEAIGDSNRTVASTNASLAKDTLGGGEKTTFRAEFATEAAVLNYRYQPRWQVRKPVRPEGSAAPKESPKPETPAAAAPPPPEAAKEAPKEAPKPVNRPDYAPAAPSASVGSPATPGGAYLPQPSKEGQPRPPQ